MFSKSFFSNEGVPPWMTAVVMIVLAAGYIYYKISLKKSGREEDANIWSPTTTLSGLEKLQEMERNQLESDENK